MQMNPSEQFAAHVVEARYEDLPDPIVARAKERLADSVGVMSAGARGVGIPGMVDMAKAWGGTEQASISTMATRCPPTWRPSSTACSCAPSTSRPSTPKAS